MQSTLQCCILLIILYLFIRIFSFFNLITNSLMYSSLFFFFFCYSSYFFPGQYKWGKWSFVPAETCRWMAVAVAYLPTHFRGQTRNRCHSGSCSRSRGRSHGRGTPGTSLPLDRDSHRVLSFCRKDGQEHNQSPGGCQRSSQSAG